LASAFDQRRLTGLSNFAANFDSNTEMDSVQKTDHRLTELEIKASFTEDLLDELNLIIVRQQGQIDLLTRELSHLRQQLPAEGGAATFRSLRDELPPHF
jgi:SlyX protein